MLDTNSEGDARITERLGAERIIWMTTVRADGQPQTSPVWYFWDGEDFQIYSLDSARARNVAGNPKVSLHLNDDGQGDDVLTMDGEATIDPTLPSAGNNEPYRRRYDSFVIAYGWTWDWYEAKYSVPIRVRPTKIRHW